MASTFDEQYQTNYDQDCIPDYKVAGANCNGSETADLQTQVRTKNTRSIWVLLSQSKMLPRIWGITENVILGIHVITPVFHLRTPFMRLHDF